MAPVSEGKDDWEEGYPSVKKWRCCFSTCLFLFAGEFSLIRVWINGYIIAGFNCFCPLSFSVLSSLLHVVGSIPPATPLDNVIVAVIGTKCLGCLHNADAPLLPPCHCKVPSGGLPRPQQPPARFSPIYFFSRHCTDLCKLSYIHLNNINTISENVFGQFKTRDSDTFKKKTEKKCQEFGRTQGYPEGLSKTDSAPSPNVFTPFGVGKQKKTFFFFSFFFFFFLSLPHMFAWAMQGHAK